MNRTIADFLCKELRLIVEVDGITHFDDDAYRNDLRRQRDLESSGFMVIRFFHRRLTKDLVLDGTITVPFWFTRTEQNSLLAGINCSDFFGLLDTLGKRRDITTMRPDPSPDILRIKIAGRTQSVVWFYPLDPAERASQRIIELSQNILQILISNERYRQLPHARGGYI